MPEESENYFALATKQEWVPDPSHTSQYQFQDFGGTVKKEMFFLSWNCYMQDN